MTDQPVPTPDELAKSLFQTAGLKDVYPVTRNPMDILHRIVTENARRQRATHEPNLDRKREDPKTKKRNKIAAKSRKRNRRK
jgi:hypothetical protein